MFVIKPAKYNDTDAYSYMTLMGIDGVYSASRIRSDSLPDGFYRYELASGKDRRFAFVHTGRISNHAGDFLCKSPLDLKGKDSCPLSDDDWYMDEGRSFDFEGFWGHKLSIDKQISDATYKRDALVGKTPDTRAAHLSETLAQDPMMIS